MDIYVWEEYFLKAVRVLQMLCTCSHELIFEYEFNHVFGFLCVLFSHIFR